MLSISSFIDLYNNSDLELYFKSSILRHPVLNLKGVTNDAYPSDEQPSTWSDVRNIFVATRSGKLLGTVTDSNYKKYFGKRICLYIPYNYQRYQSDANTIARLFNWTLLLSGAHYTNSVRPIEGTFRKPMTRGDQYRKLGSYVCTRKGDECMTTQLHPVIEHALRNGADLTEYLHTNGDDPQKVIEMVTRHELGEADIESCQEVTVDDAQARKLLADAPIFTVKRSECNVLTYDDTVRYQLIPVKSPKDRQFYLCDEAKLNKVMLDKLKLRGVVQMKSGQRDLREAISCGYLSVAKSGECGGYVKKLFEFFLNVIGTGDMYVIEPIVYGLYSSGPGFYSNTDMKPMGTSKKYKRLCKNETVQKGIESLIYRKLNGLV